MLLPRREGIALIISPISSIMTRMLLPRREGIGGAARPSPSGESALRVRGAICLGAGCRGSCCRRSPRGLPHHPDGGEHHLKPHCEAARTHRGIHEDHRVRGQSPPKRRRTARGAAQDPLHPIPPLSRSHSHPRNSRCPHGGSDTWISGLLNTAPFRAESPPVIP